MRNLVFLLLVAFSLPTLAETWYVRPSSGGTYGSDDGTTYANAWNSMADVVWGVSGVNSGDTLYVCGTFAVADADTAFGFLQVDQTGAIIDGDCSAEGGSSIAIFDGGGSFDSGVRCDASCAGQTWKNIQAINFDIRGFYFRNGFSAAATANFTGVNLQCSSILSTDANLAGCVQGWGVTASISNSSSIRTTDDAFHWEGPNFSLTDSYCKDPGYASDSNLGDCVQVAIDPDNAYIARNTFYKETLVSDTGNMTKQAIAITDVNSADAAIIEDNVVYMSLTGNSTNAAKCIYSEIPNAVIQRNYCRGGYEQIFVAGAGSTVRANIANRAESKAFNLASTVSSGTHTFTNNIGARTSTCADLNGGASVTVNAYNNLMLGCTTGYTKSAGNTVNQSNNAGFANTTNSSIGTLAVSSNPLLVNTSLPDSKTDFKPRSGSPLIGVGIPLNIGAVKDIGKRNCPATPSIGAWCQGSGDEILNRTTRN